MKVIQPESKAQEGEELLHQSAHAVGANHDGQEPAKAPGAAVYEQVTAAPEADASPRQSLRHPQSFPAPAAPPGDAAASAALTGEHGGCLFAFNSSRQCQGHPSLHRAFLNAAVARPYSCVVRSEAMEEMSVFLCHLLGAPAQASCSGQRGQPTAGRRWSASWMTCSLPPLQPPREG